MVESFRVRALFLSCLALALAGEQSFARPRIIQAPPIRKGDCHWVHGSFAIANGSLIRRLWIIGTKRIVAIPDSFPYAPPWMPRVLAAYANARPDQEELLGDFRICALEDSKPGVMQLVRITAVSNPTVDGRPYPTKTRH